MAGFCDTIVHRHTGTRSRTNANGNTRIYFDSIKTRFENVAARYSAVVGTRDVSVITCWGRSRDRLRAKANIQDTAAHRLPTSYFCREVRPNAQRP